MKKVALSMIVGLVLVACGGEPVKAPTTKDFSAQLAADKVGVAQEKESSYCRIVDHWKSDGTQSSWTGEGTSSPPVLTGPTHSKLRWDSSVNKYLYERTSDNLDTPSCGFYMERAWGNYDPRAFNYSLPMIAGLQIVWYASSGSCNFTDGSVYVINPNTYYTLSVDAFYLFPSFPEPTYGDCRNDNPTSFVEIGFLKNNNYPNAPRYMFSDFEKQY